MAKKILSVRMESGQIDAIKRLATSQGTTPSELIRSSFTNYEQGGILKDVQVEGSISELLLSMGGGSMAGILAYKGIKGKLTSTKSEDFDDSKIEMLSMIGAVAVAMITGIGIKELMKAIR